VAVILKKQFRPKMSATTYVLLFTFCFSDSSDECHILIFQIHPSSAVLVISFFNLQKLGEKPLTNFAVFTGYP